MEDNEASRSALYESETARNNEMQSRMAFQRHLQLEQHLHSGCGPTRLLLEEGAERNRIEIDTLQLINEYQIFQCILYLIPVFPNFWSLFL